MKNYTTRKQAKEFYRDVIGDADKHGPEQKKLVIEKIGRHDLYFLGTALLDRREDFEHGPDYRQDKIFEFCRMVQLDPNGHLDLWARFHYKTSIITQLLTVQDILNDPEITIAIFSFNNKAAKEPYIVVKTYLEYLGKHGLYLDVLYENPHKEAPRWTIDEGLVVKRKGNPREATLNAFGLIDSSPVGSHFKIRVYDDLITQDEVTNKEMIEKVIDRWSLSLALTTTLPVKHYGCGDISRYVGTRYDLNDPYVTIVEERKAAKYRKFPATHNGKKPKDGGVPILLTVAELSKFEQEMGPFVYNSQMYLDPSVDKATGFDIEWLEYYTGKKGRWWEGMNLYLLCDPANETKKTSDYTVMVVIGLCEDGNYYLIDGYRDRVNMADRADRLISFRQKYMPEKVGYEKYGKDVDIDYIKLVQNNTNRRFSITPLGGKMKKEDRIRRLIPIFKSGKFIVPPFLFFIDSSGRQRDFIKEFVYEEYRKFPFLKGGHDDMLDCVARILDPDLKAVFPDPQADHQLFQQTQEDYDVFSYRGDEGYDPLNFMH